MSNRTVEQRAETLALAKQILAEAVPVSHEEMTLIGRRYLIELSRDLVDANENLQAVERQVKRLIHGNEIESDRICNHELEATNLRGDLEKCRELLTEIGGLGLPHSTYDDISRVLAETGLR